jgi:ABC-type transport system involved in multi-copper enzyme maturation permease subunit
MRPYLAIIKDSFREALASRVLWILLILTTVVLALLAPFGMSERTGISLTPNDVTDAKGLIEKIKSEQAKPQPSPGKQIWSLMSDNYKNELQGGQGSAPRGRWSGMIYLRLHGELQEILPSRKLYDPAAWAEVKLPDEARELIGRGVDNLDDDDLPQLNRLLLESAYPAEIRPSREKAVMVSYLTWRLGTVPLAKKMLLDSVINVFVNLFVGVVGVFAGVLVTASIIPQTYAAGAIDLLLSKPISRSLVFLTKYFGGCVFIFINAAYAIGGLWLIAGLRMNQWSNRLLLCIPVFLFLFAVYYAVSALAGVVWRNAIVSVVMAVLFWAACFVVGTTKNVVENVFLTPTRLVKLVPAGDDLIAVNERSELFHWSAAKSNWEQIPSASSAQAPPQMFGISMPLVGPVYDAQHDRLFALPVAMPQFGLMSVDNALLVGERDPDWKRQTGVPAPPGTAALLVNRKGTLLAATQNGLMKLVGEPKTDQKPVKLFGMNLPVAGGGHFAMAGKEMRLGTPLAAAIDRATEDVALFDSETLCVLAPDVKGRYVERATREIDGNVAGIVAAGGGRVLLVQSNGEITLFDSGDLSPQDVYRPEGNTAPRFADVSPDGRFFAVLFHNRQLWLYDTIDHATLRVSITGNGDASAAALSSNGRLLVADRFTRVTEYELPSGKIVERRRPSLTALETVYLFAIKPIYTVFPKPGEMDNVVNYLLTGTENITIGPVNDLQTNRPRLDVRGPILSNLAFIAVVVALGCLYTQRKDF